MLNDYQTYPIVYSLFSSGTSCTIRINIEDENATLRSDFTSNYSYRRETLGNCSRKRWCLETTVGIRGSVQRRAPKGKEIFRTQEKLLLLSRLLICFKWRGVSNRRFQGCLPRSLWSQRGLAEMEVTAALAPWSSRRVSGHLELFVPVGI